MDTPTDLSLQNQHRPTIHTDLALQNQPKINHGHTIKSTTNTPQKSNTPTHEHTNRDKESIFVNLWLWVGAWKSTRTSLGTFGGDQNVWVD